MAREISNSDDFFDSRDVIARIAELEASIEREEWDEDELAALKALDEEGRSSHPGWADGLTLIRDSYFEDYAREYARDIGAIASDTGWPADRIDWKAAAEDLQVDYAEIGFDGVTYWYR